MFLFLGNSLRMELADSVIIGLAVTGFSRSVAAFYILSVVRQYTFAKVMQLNTRKIVIQNAINSVRQVINRCR